MNEHAFPYEQNETDAVEYYYGIHNDDENAGRHQPLGACSTPATRALAWPNTLQHRVAPFELVDKARPGSRSILVYFLVDPYRRVRSTASVPPQQRSWLARELRRMALFRLLSDELLELILSYLPGLLTYEQACERRAHLMHERKFFEGMVNEEVFERPFSLCEH